MNVPSDKCSGYGLIELLKDKPSILGIEIGCDLGTTTAFLLEKLPNLFLHGIDPYENYIDWNSNRLYERQEVYEKFQQKTIDFKDRLMLHREKSDDAFHLFKKESMDFIFIDGLHTYDQVKKDCENYYPLLKKGGLFSGHDYNTISDVQKAVKEFAISCDKEQIFLTDFDVWYYYK